MPNASPRIRKSDLDLWLERLATIKEIRSIQSTFCPPYIMLRRHLHNLEMEIEARASENNWIAEKSLKTSPN